jgi:hypothetical protein
MVGRPTGQARLYFGVAVAVLLMIGIVMVTRQPQSAPTNTATNTNARATYTSLYDSLWRQDSGKGSILVTATLFVPPMINALGEDTQRSEVEEQLWNNLKRKTANDVGIYITTDSVAGFVTDADLEAALSLQATPGPAFTLKSWQPLIGPSRPVNANVAVVSQRGLAIFTTDEPVDWS